MIVSAGCADRLLREREDARALPQVRSSIALPFGDYRALEDIQVSLYLPDWNRDRLVSAADTVSVYAGEDIASAVATRELTRLSAQLPNLGGAMLSLAPVTDAVERAGEIVFVNVDSNIWLLETSEKSVVRMALTQTLTELPGVSFVSVMINGRNESVDNGGTMPYGLLTRSTDDDIESYMNWLGTPASAEDGGLTRTAALFFASPDGQRILPEARQIIIPPGPRESLRERLVSTILNEMALGSANRDVESSRLPIEFMIGGPQLFSPGGSADTLLRLSFRAELLEYFIINGVNEYLLYAALTETLTGFIPGLDGLTIQIGGETLTSVPSPSGNIALTNGRMSPQDFPGVTAYVATVYLPREDGTGLVAVKRTFSQQESGDPRALLKSLLAGPMPYDNDPLLTPPLPAEDNTPSAFTDADLLGVTIISGEALVNLSEELASACIELTFQQARGFIFSIVNTLTEMRGIKTVRFFVDGQERDLFAQPDSASDARPYNLSGSDQTGMTSLGTFYRQPAMIIRDFVNIDES